MLRSTRTRTVHTVSQLRTVNSNQFLTVMYSVFRFFTLYFIKILQLCVLQLVYFSIFIIHCFTVLLFECCAVAYRLSESTVCIVEAVRRTTFSSTWTAALWSSWKRKNNAGSSP